ncbi:MAG: VOC family protein [Bacteroidetes bacterium]|nr:VOC family protein [Bacteroidota bacterium]MDA1121064.1 VOC family protein [Bacteroidota bacterium]
MSLYFDHVVLKVNDLEQSIKDFESQGFTVSRGGIHGGSLSENALIYFKDDSFIELFCLTKSFKSTVLRFLHHNRIFRRFQYSAKWGLAYRFYSRSLELKEGISDICFLSDGFDQECIRIDKGGLFLAKVLIASRRLIDKSRIKWQMVSPFINEMPFFRSPYQPVREIDDKLKAHKNGAEGLGKVVIMALDFKDTVSKYQIFLGQDPIPSISDEKFKTTFRLKQTKVEILKASEDQLVLDKIRGRGIGIYGLQLIGSDFQLNHIDESKLHGLALIDK